MSRSVNEISYMLLKLKESGDEVASGNAVNNFARFITMLIIFILVLVLTYYTTRFVAGAKKGSLKTGNMELLESLQLGGGKYLQLLRLGSRYIVLAVTKDHVEMLTELDADEYIKTLEIKTASQETPIKSLSGGNQQKVILARWLLTHPQYLILDEPTRGIDVGTKTEIQRLVLKLAEEGMSVTFISSEIEEMLRTCSRLIVMRDRKIVGELTGDQLNQDTVMKTIAGGEQA